ncbi:MAG: response regulator [Verrucomicrobia bacterium]|nr:response regulator [Verrucomicrobiota bacterium]
MNDKQLPVFTRDQRTGVIKPEVLARASGTALPSPARVLVADDCETDRELTIRHLGKAWPFERDMLVECAANGRMALEKLRRSRFALAVLDWNMPYLGGGDVLRTIRADGMCIPVVVVAGQRREDIVQDLESMAAAFVHKDELNPISLCNAIAASLQLPGVQWKI